MTNKERFIKAMEKTIEKHKHPVGHLFLSYSDCSLCSIAGKKQPEEGMCHPCPYALDKEGNLYSQGCSIVMNHYNKYGDLTSGDEDDDDTVMEHDYEAIEQITSAVNLLEAHLEFIKEQPVEMFTKKGWKPFNLQ